MLCICFVIFIPAFCWDFCICWGANLGRKPKNCSKRCQRCSFQVRTGPLTPFDGSYPTVILPWTTSQECDTTYAHQSSEVLTMNRSTLSKIQQAKWKWFFKKKKKKKHLLINYPTWLRDYQGSLNLRTLGWNSHKQKPPTFPIKHDRRFKR